MVPMTERLGGKPECLGCGTISIATRAGRKGLLESDLWFALRDDDERAIASIRVGSARTWRRPPRAHSPVGRAV